MGDACEEWLICDLAAQSLGAIVYGIYPTARPPRSNTRCATAAPSIFIAENQEYVDKILPLADRLPAAALDRRASIDPRCSAIEHPKLRSYDDVACDAQASRISTGLRSRPRALDPNDPAFIVYTSGTTGHPKGALVTHGKHLAATANVVDHYPTLAAEGAPHGRSICRSATCSAATSR